MMALPSTGERGRRASRGQPVIALAMILAMWIAVRMTIIAIEADPPAGASRVAQLSLPERLAPPPRRAPLAPKRPAAPGHHHAGISPLAAPPVPHRDAGSAERAPLATAAADVLPAAQIRRTGSLPVPAEAFAPNTGTLPVENRGSAGARLTYLAPPSARSGDGSTPPDEPPGQTTRPRLPRWSADGWVLLRGDQAPALAAGAAAYGGSQAGAVLRYGLAPASRLRPQAYVRFSAALGANVRQNEAALGLMLRPVRALPLAVLGEGRLQVQSGQTRLRPVVMAVTELPPLHLPLDAEAEIYAQAGWAGGRGATPFYDMAATFERRLFRPLPGTELNGGGGVWSGGQRGAVRLDVGPRVELRGMVGPSSRRIGVRVGVDWRFRVAGDAKPGSGPALTVAAGF